MTASTNTPKNQKKPIYHEELKSEFISYKGETISGLAKALFRRSYLLEKTLGRDLYTFSLTEIEEIFKSSTSEEPNNDYNVIKSYLEFCQGKGLVDTYVLEGINKNYFKNILEDNRLRIKEEDLNSYIDSCNNNQDKLILKLLFEGVLGEGLSELFNLTLDDVDKGTNTLHLRCKKDGERNIKVSDECIRLIEEASKDDTYYFNNGERLSERGASWERFCNNNYVIRKTVKKEKDESKPADRSYINSRFGSFKEWFDKPKLSPNVVYQSGLIDYSIKLSKELGIHVREFKHKNHWSRVATKYPMKLKKDSRGVLQYNAVFRYIRYDEIDILYGNYLNESFVLQADNEIKTDIFEKKKRVSVPRFRKMIINIYNGRCAITGEDTLETLEACHIQEYKNENSNHHQNGILLRADFHKLYDKGLILINEDYRIIVSDRITSEYYKQFNGMRIRLPEREENYPSKDALKYHCEKGDHW